jgi:hypothetical protein
LTHLMDFFDAHPQGDERAHSYIKIGAFSPPHNLWPTSRKSELVLKKARFIYVLVMRMPFYLCQDILQTMLEMRAEHFTGLLFVCLVTKICLHSVTDIAETKPMVSVQDPLGGQTLMNSNAQLWFEGQGEAPQPPPVQVDQHAATSFFKIAPPPPSYDAAFSHIMEA